MQIESPVMEKNVSAEKGTENDFEGFSFDAKEEPTFTLDEMMFDSTDF